jgi:hypothetical protein
MRIGDVFIAQIKVRELGIASDFGERSGKAEFSAHAPTLDDDQFAMSGEHGAENACLSENTGGGSPDGRFSDSTLHPTKHKEHDHQPK